MDNVKILLYECCAISLMTFLYESLKIAKITASEVHINNFSLYGVMEHPLIMSQNYY